MTASRLDIVDAKTFLMGSRAEFTLVSAKTGTKFTYKIGSPKSDENGTVSPVRFVRCNGEYLGFFNSESLPENIQITAGRKGNRLAESFKPFNWALRTIVNVREEQFQQMEFWHVGKCCMCGRKLTQPKSIKSGIGPICAKK